MSEQCLELKNVCKSFRDFTLNNISFTLPQGYIMGLVGPNGAGKTTTIKACCGILQFDRGEITVDGISLKEHPLECKKRIAYLPDNPEIYQFLSGIKYLNFISDIFGVSRQDRETRIKKYFTNLKHRKSIG